MKIITDEKQYISYFLPKSRTTQQIINGRRIDKAWANICSFLNFCTTVIPDQFTSLSLFTYSNHDNIEESEISSRILSETKMMFGVGKTEPFGYHYPSGIPNEGTITEWKLENKDFKQALNYLIDGQPWPKCTFGPIELLISYNFKLINPETKVELPNQELNSSLMVWLSRSCICSPDLNFPFDSPSIQFYDYLKLINNYVPFKLEEKFLRIVRQNKYKTGYIYTKL